MSVLQRQLLWLFLDCKPLFCLFWSQAALKAAAQTKDGRDDEIAVLRTEVEVTKADNYSLLKYVLTDLNFFLILTIISFLNLCLN